MFDIIFYVRLNISFEIMPYWIKLIIIIIDICDGSNLIMLYILHLYITSACKINFIDLISDSNFDWWCFW